MDHQNRAIFDVELLQPDFITQVRLQVLDMAAHAGQVPEAAVVARALSRSPAEVVEALGQLGESHVYVVEPGDPTRLRMANPFSAVPTPFKVGVRDKSYFGNCVWDALGIVSLLGGDGRVTTDCPDCHERLQLQIAERRLVRGDGVVHFGVPARCWWDDIIHT